MEERSFPLSEDSAALPSVSIVVPTHFSHDYANRSASWHWLKQRYEALLPDAEIIEVTADEGVPFHKAKLVNMGVEMAQGQVILMSDADVVIPADALQSAVRHALTAPWVVPHGHVVRLRPEVSHKLLTEPPATRVMPGGPVIRPPYKGIAGGGMFAIRRDRFLAMGGLDPMFHGWGGEDTAFGIAANALLGHHLRYSHVTMTHLYHDPGPRALDPNYADNMQRVQAYRAYATDRTMMANFLRISLPEEESYIMTMPSREDSIFEWLLYLNYINVSPSVMQSCNKLQLMAFALQNAPREHLEELASRVSAPTLEEAARRT